MERDELEGRLESLWRRVRGEAPHVPKAPPSPASALRRRYEEELQELRGLLEAREKALAGLSERLRSAETEASSLKLRLEREENLFLEQLLSVSTALEEAQAALVSQREEREREAREADRALREERTKSLREAAESQSRLEAEKGRWEELQAYWKAQEKKWREKEEHLHERVKALEEELRKVRKVFEEAGREAARAVKERGEAAGALSKTVEELKASRRTEEDARAERERAVRKAEELEGRLQELQSVLERERTQWRELWDREHQAWESQRQEFGAWEEKLRREREAWLETMRAKEAEEVDRAAQLVQLLRQTGEWAAGRGLARRLAGAAAASALALAVLGAGAWVAGLVLAGPALVQEAEALVPLQRPTALAAAEDRLWFAEWDGSFLSVSPEEPAAVLLRGLPQGSFHPVAAAAGGGALWALDASKAGLVRLDPQDPSRALARLASPGAVPTAVAFDGEALWTFDASSRALWRQAAGGGDARRLAAPDEFWPASLHWSERSLWAHDARSGELVKLAPGLERARVRLRVSLPGRPVAAAVGGGKVWTLSPAGSDRYRLRRYRLERWGAP